MRYVIDRVLQSAVTLLLLAGLVFVLARVLGDPTTYMLQVDASAEEAERLRRLLGIDRPPWEQFLGFVGGLLSGDLGTSIRSQMPVASLIGERLDLSLRLVLVASLFAVVVSLVLGTLSAVWRGGPLDLAVRMLAVIGQSAPSFWIGIVLIQLLAIRWGLLPTAGVGGFASYLMPAFTLSLPGIAGMTRLLRSSMLEVLESEYVKKARIMGVGELAVVWRHALRNACLPMITYGAEYLGHIITSAVIVEVVFAWPGMGSLAYEAVFARDYPVIQGVVIVMAAIVLVLNLGVDLLYAAVDPRIRYRT